MSDCTPCETEAPQICEELPISNDPERIVVENEYFCKETLDIPTNVSLLYYDGAKVKWVDGSENELVSLPQAALRTNNIVPRLGSATGTKALEYWTPPLVGTKYLLYWDGVSFTNVFTADILVNFFSSYFNGLLVKEGNTISFKSGTHGQYLVIENGQIIFKTLSPATPPSGTILYFAGSTIPSGFLLCDGSEYGRTLSDPNPQPTLFSIIGTIYGSGNGSTTFNIPDLRGVFVRGLDNNRNIDPLRNEGILQNGGFKTHNHGGNVGIETNHTHTLSGTSGNQSNDHRHFSVNNQNNGNNISTTKPYINYSYFTNPLNADIFTVQQYELLGDSTEPTIGLTNNNSTTHIHTISGTFSAGTPHVHGINSSGILETRPINVAINCIIKT